GGAASGMIASQLPRGSAMTRLLPALGLLLVLPLALAFAQTPAAQPTASKPGFFAIAIHGGAGTIPKTVPNEERVAYLKSLGAARDTGLGFLAKGGRSRDAVEKVVNYLEDDPLFNAGKGAVFTHDGG